jgi:CO/xanthine dehydrogenase FAD-binding subunit
MDFLQPDTWEDALALRDARSDAVAITGGTDVMVEINFDRRRPRALLDLTRVPELSAWGFEDGRIRLGASVTYARIISELADRLPGLAMAARTIGSPQIRNRGTVGGNLGAASPAGDAHPPLLAAEADVEVVSMARGVRRIPVADFYTGVKRTVLQPDELIAAVLITPPAGPQQFCKIGTRNAMVIAVAAFAVALHPDRRAVGTGIGSAAPTPRRAADAETFLAGELTSTDLWEKRSPLPDGLAAEFGRRVASASAPIDDVRGTASYRRGSLAVLARRAVGWAWDDYRKAA